MFLSSTDVLLGSCVLTYVRSEQLSDRSCSWAQLQLPSCIL